MGLPSRHQCLLALDKVMAHEDGVVACMFVLRDGRCHAERSRTRMPVGKFAAMSSSLMSLSHTVMVELAADSPGYLLIEGRTHKLVACRVPGIRTGLIMALLAKSELSLGLALGYARSCIRDVSGTDEDEAHPRAGALKPLQ